MMRLFRLVLPLALLSSPALTLAGEPLCEERAAYLAARAYALALPIFPREELERHVADFAADFGRNGEATRCLIAMSRAVDADGFANVPTAYERRFRTREAERRTPAALWEIAPETPRALLGLLLDQRSVATELKWLARASVMGARGDWSLYDEPQTLVRSHLYEQRAALEAICAQNDDRCRRYRRSARGLADLVEERMLLLALGEIPMPEETMARGEEATAAEAPASVGSGIGGLSTARPPPTLSMPPASANGGLSSRDDITVRSAEPAMEATDVEERSADGELALIMSDEAPGLPRFPWPPPRFSSRSELSRDYFANDAFLGEVADTLELALEHAGHVEWSYYSVPKGFALATRLENLEADGSPKSDRWASTVGLGRDFSIADYLRALFTAPAGYFRIIVLTVTSEPFTPTEAGPTREEAMEWVSAGGTGLPRAIAEIPFGPDYECIALVYEFEKRDEQAEAVTLVPGRHPGRTHLQKSHVIEGLQR
jgi:hypothetical protein